MTHTTDPPAVSVIVPVYNEEENVPILQAELRAALRGVDHEFIFVDDGSADHTVERIEAAPNLRVIRFEKNAGQSAAIYAGLQAARGAILVLIDGDLQNDPADIPKLLDEISRGADLVCGYRAQPDCERRSQPIHERRRARHRLHAQSNAARMCQRAVSVQGNASLHSCADQRRRVPVGGNSGEPSPAAVWSN
jgi:glycosyltransferase involved in cell wall biosynthesis